MRILVLGGTGAMGVPLVKLLNTSGHSVFVTSRTQKQSYENITFLTGNAQEDSFLRDLLKKNFDVIIDFMVYPSKVFEERISEFLSHTDQYFFFSSSRVYAASSTSITETSSRLLDVCKDQDYLQTDEYALAKAREEDVLFSSKRKNWTIIRPYITYNSQRLQLGVYEKENWLYRALSGRTIVLPSDIAKRVTTLTSGDDVAYVLMKLIGNQKALGEAFHITGDTSITWMSVLEIYQKQIMANTGIQIKVKLTENSEGLKKVWNSAQIQYDRCYDRIFCNDKIKSVCGDITFRSPTNGLSDCITNFLLNKHWLSIKWKYEAWCDHQTGERTPLSEINGNRNKLRYIKNRYFNVF